MLEHREIDRAGVRLHYVLHEPVLTDSSSGPVGTVVLLHGFPHFWFTWHRLIPVLARAGWRVIAPDLRGMGRSAAPDDVADYAPGEVVADVLAVCDDAGAKKVVLVGFDYGAGVAYDTCHLEPDRVRAVVGMQNPFMGALGETAPLDGAAQVAEKHFLHLHYLAQPGLAEADLAGREREFLARVFWALSADYHYLDVWQHPTGSTYLEALPEAPPLPWSWLSVEEMDAYEEEYVRTGFAGPLQWYRAMDVSWRERKAFARQTNPVPFYFLYSEHDPDLEGFHGRDPLAKLDRYHDDVRMVRSVPRAGHLMHLEATQDTHRELLACLADIAQSLVDVPQR